MATLRTTAPSSDNKYYKHTSCGGVNECIRISGSSCLPNCVGAAWGYWYELMGTRPRLSRRNAKDWYGYTADGYRRSRTPALGAVACWGGGQYGHVAIVVGIHSDHITVVQSNYGGSRWEMVNCYKMSNSGYKSHGGNTAFQGFILLPDSVKISTGSTGTSAGASTSTGGLRTWNLSKKYAKGKKFTVQNTKGLGLLMRDYPKTGKVRATIKEGKDCYYYGRGAIVGGIAWYWVHDYASGKEGYVYGGVLNSNKAPYLKNARP